MMGIREDRRRVQAALDAQWRVEQQERPNIGTRHEPRPHALPTIRNAPAYHCIQCHQLKAGRFTKPARFPGDSILAYDAGWSQRQGKVMWLCWDCLPKGQGIGETDADR